MFGIKTQLPESEFYELNEKRLTSMYSKTINY